MKLVLVSAAFAVTMLTGNAAAQTFEPDYVAGVYEGEDDCATLEAFPESKWHILSNRSCDVSVEFNFYEAGRNGDEYGEFTYTVTNRRGREIYRDRGTYWFALQTGNIYFAFGARHYPQAGWTYPFARVRRDRVTLATSARRGSGTPLVKQRTIPEF